MVVLSPSIRCAPLRRAGVTLGSPKLCPIPAGNSVTFTSQAHAARWVSCRGGCDAHRTSASASPDATGREVYRHETPHHDGVRRGVNALPAVVCPCVAYLT